MSDPGLKYPPFNVRIRQQGKQTQVFDGVRKKWLALTPEEWVRQHLVNYLVEIKKFPAARVALEKELQLNDTRKRYDVVLFDLQKKPLLIVECKAPYISLDAHVIEQALRYNLILKAPMLMISNGVSDLVFNNKNQQIELPDQF